MKKAKKEKNCSLFKRLKDVKISLSVGILMLFVEAILILGFVPSAEVEGESVLTANVQGVLAMINE